MKIELWAKKLDKGHVKIGEVSVSENFGYEYRMPVTPPMGVVSLDSQVALQSPMNYYRTFRFKPSDDRYFEGKRKYLEV